MMACLKKRAISLHQYYCKEMQDDINTFLRNNEVSLIVCEELSSMQYVSHIHDIPIIFNDHNIEYELKMRTLANTPLYLRPVMHREVKCIKKFEEQSWQKATLTYFVSERDYKICKESHENIQGGVVENVFSSQGISLLSCSEWYEKPTLIFVGNLSWKPNFEGLSRFLKNIYPKVKDKASSVEMIVIGSHAPKEIIQLCQLYHAKIYENLDEDKKIEILSKCWLAVVPVYFGSGTRIKILEYWAHAKTVVSTTIGAEGLHPSIGTIIEDEDSNSANEISRLLMDKGNLQELGMTNHKIFKQFYEEESVYESSLYRSISSKLTK
jgi:glycosyltransferase involved in cell wall biosynthesis